MAVEDYTKVAEGPVCPSASLASPISYLTTLIEITALDMLGGPDPAVGQGFMIDDEILVIRIVVDPTTFQVGRGCADTLPAEHDAGATVWFFESNLGSIPREYAEGEVIGVKILPKTTSGGSVPIANAPPHELTFVGRFNRPYPPARLLLNDTPWFDPGFAFDDTNALLDIAWRTRNRVTQADQLVGHDESSVAPEASQMTIIKVYDAADDFLIKVYASTTTGFKYTRTMATADFGLTGEFDPPDQVGYLLIGSVRNSVESANFYRVDFTLDPPMDSGEQPFGLGWRLGEYLGGYPAGAGGVDNTISYLEYIVTVDDKMVFTKLVEPGISSQSDTYVSEDGGRTVSLVKADAGLIGYGYRSGVGRFSAAIGTQYISLGINRYASNYVRQIEGSSDLSAPVVETIDGPFTDLGESLHVGGLYQYGSYYYVVARKAADNAVSANAGKFYLFRATTDLEFVLQGEMTAAVGDPNAIPDGLQSGWSSHWFTPNGPTPGIYESSCELWRGYANRWFINNGGALYYTDNAAALTNWRRCPIPSADADGSFRRVLLVTPKLTNGVISALYPASGVGHLYWSSDNGITWQREMREQTGFEQYWGLNLMPKLLNDKWVIYTGKAYESVRVSMTAVADWPAVAPEPVTGMEPDEEGDYRTGIRITQTEDIILFADYPAERLMFTEDGVNFEYTQVVSVGPVFLQNFTTDESDEIGNTEVALWNDAAVSGGVVQFSGDGYMRVDQPYQTFAYGEQDFTFELFVTIDSTGSQITTQWIVAYGDNPTKRGSSALSIMANSNSDLDETSFTARVQMRDAEGIIYTYLMNSIGIASTDTMYHLAIQRRGQGLEFFVDGVLNDDATVPSDQTLFGRPTGAIDPLFFGGGPEVASTDTDTDDNPMTGSISAVRVTRGTVLYPYAGFTPPTLPLTA